MRKEAETDTSVNLNKKMIARYFFAMSLGVMCLAEIGGCTSDQKSDTSSSSPLEFDVKDRQVSMSNAVARVLGPEKEQTLRSSKTMTVKVELHLAEGWHVNAHNPAQRFLIGTKLSWELPEGLQIQQVNYPPSDRMQVGFSEEPLAVFTGVAPVKVKMEASAAAVPGKKTISGKALVQACNEDRCLAPSRLPFSVDIYVDG